MKTNRRSFIKNAGMAAVGIGFMPMFTFGENSFQKLTNTLPRKTPESQGIDSAGIRNFIKAANESGLEFHSFMLLRHGNVVAEGWWSPFEPTFKHTLYSLSKSFTSTAIGMLVTDGKLSVEDFVLPFFPDDAPKNPSENLKKLKVKHLLTMSSGHGKDTLPGMLESDKGIWTKSFLEQPLDFEPGTHFLYNTGATYMLGAILHKITGQTLKEYLTPRLFKPLGIEGYDWEVSPQGLNTAGFGLRVKTEDIAKFGQMYLQKGKWQNQQILPAKWVEEATTSHIQSGPGNGDWGQGYGYQFWRCKPGFYRGDGAYGQYCIVMPEQDAVLVMTSESTDMQKSMITAWENLLPAIKTTALAENPQEAGLLKKDLANLTLKIPKGKTSSPIAEVYNGKSFKFEINDFGADAARFDLNKDGCKWTVTTKDGNNSIVFGWENWLVNKGQPKNLFPVPRRTEVPSKTAGTATWLDDNTLQLNVKFVEAIHGDKITCKFDKDQVTISFQSSLAPNRAADKRKDLIGKIVA